MTLKTNKIREFPVAIAVSLFAAIVFYFSTKATLHDLDYTSQIASALLHGQLGLQDKPPDWLNEMIPWEGRYYSAFPLGAVISMLPVALLRNTGLIQNFPGHILASLIAGLCVYFFFQLANAFRAAYSSLEGKSLARRIHAGSVSNFRNLDMVQPRIRRRLANRSWFRFARASRSTLFYSGPPIAICCRSVLHPGFWKSNRATHHIASLPLFVLAPARWATRSGGLQSAANWERDRTGGFKTKIPWEQPNAHPFRKPACNTRARDCRL